MHADEDSTDYDDSADESASAAIHIEDDPCIVVDHVTEFSPRSTEVAVDPALRETDEFDIPTNAEDEAVLDPTNPTPPPRPIAPESAQLTDDGYVVFEVGCGVEQPESAKHVPEMAEETTLNHSLDPHQGEAELSGEQPTDESIDEVSKEIFVDDPYASLDAEREGSRLPSVKTPSAPQAETVELPEDRDETSLEQQLLETVEDLRCEVQAATDDDLPGPIEFPTEEPVEYDVVYPSEVDNVLDEPTVDVPEPSSESDEEEPWVANLEVPDGDEPTTVEASADLQDTGQETAEPEDHFLTLPEMLGSDAADVASIETDEPLDDDAVTHRLAETLDSTTSPRRRYAQLFTRLRERRRAHARVQRAG
ncbi:unnamed protein product [Durusdinium trenchii]|uniref:Uncharacterized protein n=1 Tax=Durusdinium trenchii TaxID=1381693 RepID=A0ABP0PA54_9DINO